MKETTLPKIYKRYPLKYDQEQDAIYIPLINDEKEMVGIQLSTLKMLIYYNINIIYLVNMHVLNLENDWIEWLWVW